MHASNLNQKRTCSRTLKDLKHKCSQVEALSLTRQVMVKMTCIQEAKKVETPYFINNKVDKAQNQVNQLTQPIRIKFLLVICIRRQYKLKTLKLEDFKTLKLSKLSKQELVEEMLVNSSILTTYVFVLLNNEILNRNTSKVVVSSKSSHCFLQLHYLGE